MENQIRSNNTKENEVNTIFKKYADRVKRCELCGKTYTGKTPFCIDCFEKHVINITEREFRQSPSTFSRGLRIEVDKST